MNDIQQCSFHHSLKAVLKHDMYCVVYQINSHSVSSMDDLINLTHHAIGLDSCNYAVYSSLHMSAFLCTVIT